ncbi:APE3 [Candida oxycetoniae]|uniref:Peptide hydrolase n=1 Tax=Candida oxycetoniae TaxID=497107 RepID=A0AAI9T0F9_9ASCO|nr:APE3 [Candida oxycetoniae]KAI3406104.2 APE3 [Candida oxycetoniae]
MVYAYHGPLIYEAKIIKVKKADESYILNSDLQKETFEQNSGKFDVLKWEGLDAYLLHYQGWNSKWDEWVGFDRILEINEENKFKKLELEQLTKKKKSKRESNSSDNGKGGGSGNKRSKISSTSAGNGSKLQQKKISTINLKFPVELKYVLVNDWQYITKDKKLVKLPTEYSVNSILQEYKSWRSSKLQKHQVSILVEIITGLELYFNKAVTLVLLYKNERLQHLGLIKNNTITRDMGNSKVYGYEHLLRLLISFPNLISQTTMDSLSISVLVSELEELLNYLKENMTVYQNDYEYTSPQYDSLARVKSVLLQIYACSFLTTVFASLSNISFEKLQKRHQDVESIFSSKGPTSLVLQEFDKLVHDLELAIEGDNDSIVGKKVGSLLMPQVLFKRAMIEINLNKDTLAIIDLQQVLGLAPAMTPARDKLVELLISRGDFEKLEAFLEEKDKKKERDNSEIWQVINNYKTHWKQANLAYNQKNYEGCVDELNKVVDICSSNYEVWKLYLNCQLQNYKNNSTKYYTFDNESQPLNKIIIKILLNIIKIRPYQTWSYDLLSKFQIYTEINFEQAQNSIKSCIQIDNESDCGAMAKFCSRFSEFFKALETYSILNDHLCSESSDLKAEDMNNYKIDYKQVANFLLNDKVSNEVKRKGFKNNFEYLRFKGEEFSKEYTHFGDGDELIFLADLQKIACESLIQIGDSKYSAFCSKIKDSREHPHFFPNYIPQIDKLLKQKKFAEAEEILGRFNKNVKQTELFKNRASKVEQWRQQQQQQQYQQHQQHQQQQRQRYHQQQQRQQQQQYQQQQQQQYRQPNRKSKNDYYKILDIPHDADEKTIRKGYKTQTLKYHPDKYKGKDLSSEQIEKKMQDINKAYEILSDKELRERYDRGDDPNDPMNTAQSQPQWQQYRGSSNPHGQEQYTFNFGGANSHDFFQQFFGGMGGMGATLSAILSTIDASPAFKLSESNILINQKDFQSSEDAAVAAAAAAAAAVGGSSSDEGAGGDSDIAASQLYEDFEPFALDEDLIDETIYSQLPEIDSEKLQSLVDRANLRKRAETLYAIAQKSQHKYGHPTRVIGSPGHFATVHYIIRELRKLHGYYNIKTQSFKAVDGHVDSFSLLIDGIQPKNLQALALTPPTPDKKPVHGSLTLVLNNGCSLHDFPQIAKDNIVLIKRGECSFGDKSRNAGKVGAKAAIIYDSNGPLSGTLGTPIGEEVPTLSVDQKDVASYIDELNKNPNHKFETTLYIDSYVKNITTLNVVAETVFGDHNNVVSLGAHSDSVGAGPGINDDGSGTISLLEVAKILKDFKINNAVRFAWWAAEEEGLLGSEYYASHLTQEENSKIRLFMDYDMMASPNYEYEIYNANNKDHPQGSGDLKDLYVAWYEKHGLNYTFVPFDGRSDYVGFINNGIPAGGIATGAEGVKNSTSREKFGGEVGKWFDPCYHQKCDDLSNPNYDAWEINTKLIAHSVAVYAKSFEGFPKRELKEDKVQLSSSSSTPEFGTEFIRRGDKFVI